MATLLKGIVDQRALRVLNYADNELGRETAEQISRILFWPNPTHLEKFILRNVKTNFYSIAIILSALKTNRRLIHFELEKVSLNNPKNFDYLCLFFKANREIKNLRLSWNSLLPNQIIEVMSLIKRRKTIQFLDLSYNSLAPEPRHMHLAKQFVNMMRRFILRS